MTNQLNVLALLFIRATDTQKQNIIDSLRVDGVDTEVFEWLASLSSSRFKEAIFADM